MFDVRVIPLESIPFALCGVDASSAAPRVRDCSTKCQNVKNKASGQRAPILDVLAFHAFRSLRGPAEGGPSGKVCALRQGKPLVQVFA